MTKEQELTLKNLTLEIQLIDVTQQLLMMKRNALTARHTELKSQCGEPPKEGDEASE